MPLLWSASRRSRVRSSGRCPQVCPGAEGSKARAQAETEARAGARAGAGVRLTHEQPTGRSLAGNETVATRIEGTGQLRLAASRPRQAAEAIENGMEEGRHLFDRPDECGLGAPRFDVLGATNHGEQRANLTLCERRIRSLSIQSDRHLASRSVRDALGALGRVHRNQHGRDAGRRARLSGHARGEGPCIATKCRSSRARRPSRSRAHWVAGAPSRPWPRLAPPQPGRSDPASRHYAAVRSTLCSVVGPTVCVS